mmetsp:Transcript_25666/g.59324  ORF Transcript_25666/g.59324 Transcript_25666/m.59324 type:complete len:600 (-) Transcript_25666:26-1825(-)
MPRATQIGRERATDPDARYDVDEDESLVDGGRVERVKERVSRSSELDKTGPSPLRYIGIAIALTLLIGAVVWTYQGTDQFLPGTLKVVTWNIAAINNNPFEYWITHEDPGYNLMMSDVEAFLENPGDADVPLSEVFRQTWVDELKELMQKEEWPDVDKAVDKFREDYLVKTIASGFLKDKKLGLKRLVSMPDRMTNTINLASGGTACRPAVDNCYKNKFRDLDDWWTQWKGFMFDRIANGTDVRGADRIAKISSKKYPDLTEEEEKMSKALSTLCQAAFDAITIHMLSTVGSAKHKEKWQDLRLDMCEKLNDRKSDRTLEILDGAYYSNADIIFLQEVAGAFVASMRQSDLGEKFEVVATDTTRDQNSVILLNKRSFEVSTIQHLTREVSKVHSKNSSQCAALPHREDLLRDLYECGGVADGDLISIAVQGTLGKFLLASFHGDTNGQQTIPVLNAMHQLAQNRSSDQLLFGLDANTYGEKKAKYQYVVEFGDAYLEHGYSSCWGDKPDPQNHTTFNARTYLQPQLNKAVRLVNLTTSPQVDKNPKDFIIFKKDLWRVARTWKDNTGNGQYIEDMVFPTLSFPSDHGLLATELELLGQP